MPVTILEM